MAIILQPSLFSWKDVDSLGDLERLKLVIENFPDEDLVRLLERKRKRGRNDYPVRAVWNSLLAGVIFQHKSIESLRRELLRNAQLRQLCGFDVVPGLAIVPSSWAFSRFLKIIFRYQTEIDAMFAGLVDSLSEILPGFFKRLAIDSKAISSHAVSHKSPDPMLQHDGRRDLDADFGKKSYKGINEDGTAWEKIKTWFGYKIHLLVDADYELPVAYSVTKASTHDAPEGHNLLDKVSKNQPQVLMNCDYLMGDRGYDDTKLIAKLWDEYQIRPIIDIRNMWKDSESSRLFPGETNVTFDFKGEVTCHCPKSGDERKMAFGGFEKDRSTLKYVCPVQAYGASCLGCTDCPIKHSIRINMSTDRRVFTPVARSTYKWKDLYKARTSVERVNSRLDVSFGFEEHYIRGMKKMKFRCGLALCVMLAMALGRARQGQMKLIRSLVQTRAA